MATKNRQILFRTRPEGIPTDETFQFVEVPVPVPNEDEVLVRALYISVDPYMRGRMTTAKSYVAPFELGKPIESSIVAQVVESNSASFQPGDVVSSHIPLHWQEYQVVKASRLYRLDTTKLPVTAPLGVLGIPGLTAYFGMEICDPKPGETFVVSAAAGAVGSLAGQIAKIKGCRVVGFAGSDEKIAFLKDELGFDEGINYKTAEKLTASVKTACPDGVDMYFENVGGKVTQSVMPFFNDFARIAICGLISDYNSAPAPGPSWVPFVIHRIKAQGFIVSDFYKRFQEASAELASWMAEGKLKMRETIVEGFENTPSAFIGLFHGENTGKQIVKVADPE